MRIRFQPWQLAIVLVLACGAAIGFIRWERTSRPYDARELLAALPANRATLFYLDVGVLRRSGILDVLAGSQAVEEPDYRTFVEQTGFDYRTDLDAVAGASVSNSTYLTIRGRFDWKQLAAYARSQGGTCQYTACSLPGNSSEKNISFYPIRSDVLALAISPSERGINMITPGQSRQLPLLPADPVWVSVPTQALREFKTLPAGFQMLLGPLADAGGLTFTLGPQGDRFQLRAEIACSTADAAASVTRQLQSVTEGLKKIADRDQTRDPADLTEMLVSGSFAQKESIVTATWPVERKLIEALGSKAP